jgi:PAS domain S-box-containing protein
VRGLPEIDALRLIETAGDGIWAVDDEARTTYVNDAMAAMLGHTAEELAGRPVGEFMEPAEAERVAARLERRRGGHAESYPCRLLHRDGRTVWTVVSATPRAGGGSVAKVVDVTEHREAEAALLARETALRTAAELQDGMLQRLVLASYALDRDDQSAARAELSRALEEARRLIGDLMAGDEPRPGALRRTGTV